MYRVHDQQHVYVVTPAVRLWTYRLVSQRLSKAPQWKIINTTGEMKWSRDNRWYPRVSPWLDNPEPLWTQSYCPDSIHVSQWHVGTLNPIILPWQHPRQSATRRDFEPNHIALTASTSVSDTSGPRSCQHWPLQCGGRGVFLHDLI